MIWESWFEEQAATRDAAGLRRSLRPRGARDGVVDLAGNDYLGLSRHPVVAAAAAEAARTWGAGAGASRLVTGTLELHEELEAALAGFTGQEAALVMSTGYHANLSVVTALADRDCLVVSDAHVHASLVDAARLSRAEVAVTRHSDVAAVSAALAQAGGRRALVLAESVYSVLGDAAPLLELAGVCASYDALLVVDEAHGIGVVGEGGHGLVRDLGLHEQDHVVVTATLSKSLGAQGGAVLGTRAVADHLVNQARPFIFDTGLAPAAAAGALAALHVLGDHPGLPDLIHERVGALAAALGVPPSDGAVLSVPMPSPEVALGRPVGGARGRRPGGLFPAALGPGRDLPAADHHQRGDRGSRVEPRRDCPGAGRQGVRLNTRAGRIVVVTGTGTGVGKTIATAALALRAATSGSVVVVKPVQTGIGPGSGERADADVVHELTGCAVQELTALEDPLAPDTAARLRGVRIPPVAEYVDRIRVLAEFHDTVVVEGAGGLLVRLDTDGATILDLAVALAAEVVVVTAAGLGTLNHTELTVVALRARGVEPTGLVIGSWPDEPGLAETCNLDDLPRVSGVPVLARIPAGAGALTRAEFARQSPTWFA